VYVLGVFIVCFSWSRVSGIKLPYVGQLCHPLFYLTFFTFFTVWYINKYIQKYDKIICVTEPHEIRGYRGGSTTAVQAWRLCRLWKPSLSYPIVLLYRGFAVFSCMCILLYCCILCCLLFLGFLYLCSVFSFSTLILSVGSFDL